MDTPSAAPLNSDLAIAKIHTMDDGLSASVAGPRFNTSQVAPLFESRNTVLSDAESLGDAGLR
jgi:hypothetical protein